MFIFSQKKYTSLNKFLPPPQAPAGPVLILLKHFFCFPVFYHTSIFSFFIEFYSHKIGYKLIFLLFLPHETHTGTNFYLFKIQSYLLYINCNFRNWKTYNYTQLVVSNMKFFLRKRVKQAGYNLLQIIVFLRIWTF